MDKKMRNRDGVEYQFEAINEDTYTLVGDFGPYWRYGGLEGQEGVDTNNLGFVDPSGGPFIDLHSKIEDRQIVRISVEDGKVLFKVSPRDE